MQVPYLIDGNNLLGSWGGRKHGGGSGGAGEPPQLERGGGFTPTPRDDRRAEVVRRVLAFCRGRRARATLVFDGHPLRADLAAQDLGPVSIRVPPPGTDADTVIRELIDRAPRPAELIVVTSDKALYSYARTMGASVLRAHEWNALERRIGQARERAPGAEKPEREDDVEGWLRRFGGE